MSGLTVQVDAAKTNRSLVTGTRSRRRQFPLEDVQLLFWRRQIDSAVADAKRTHAGIPTDLAILQRWWLEDHRPKQTDRDEWERSFECACSWLSLDAASERTRLLQLIDEALHIAFMDHVRAVVYQRKAAVLTCAGIPRAIGKQRVLPLVSESDYEDVAGIEHADPPPRLMRRDRRKRKAVVLEIAA